jgi:transposase
MTKIHQIADFSGQTIHVGMDVHLKQWNITLYNNQQYLRKFQQESNPETLIKHLTEHYPNAHFKLAYEAGFCGFWIQRAFTKAGMECIVVNAADVPQTDKGMRTKNDVTDSKRIGASLSGGMLKPIYIPNEQTESDRSLVRYRYRLRTDLNRSKTRIKSLLHKHGIRLPEEFANSKWTRALLKWLKELQIPYSFTKLTLTRMIEQVEYLQAQILQLTRDLRIMLKSDHYNTQAKLLMSVPGIGALTALTMLTEISDIRRFKTFYHFNSFIGFCPTEFSSGESERKGSITPRHHSLLRSITVEMAWTAIRLDPAMCLAYNDYKKRMTPKRAIIRIARKMLNRIYHLLIKQQTYVKGVTK